MSEPGCDRNSGRSFFMVTPNQLYYSLIIYFPQKAKKKIAERSFSRNISTCSSVSDCEWSKVAAIRIFFSSSFSLRKTQQFSVLSLALRFSMLFGVCRRQLFFSPAAAPLRCWRKVLRDTILRQIKIDKSIAIARGCISTCHALDSYQLAVLYF